MPRTMSNQYRAPGAVTGLRVLTPGEHLAFLQGLALIHI